MENSLIMSSDFNNVVIDGDSDNIINPGETIEFKISSNTQQDYQARLVKVICGDANLAKYSHCDC